MKLTTVSYLFAALTSLDAALGLPTEASTSTSLNERAASFRADYSGKLAFKDDKGKTLGYYRGYCLGGLDRLTDKKADGTTVYFNKTSNGLFQLFQRYDSPDDCPYNSTVPIGIWATPAVGPNGQQGDYLKDLSADDPATVNMVVELYKRTYYNSVNDTKTRSDSRAKIWTYDAKTQILSMQWVNAKGQVFKPRPVNVYVKYFVPPIPYGSISPGVYDYAFTSWASDATKFARNQSLYQPFDLERRVTVGNAYLEP